MNTFCGMGRLTRDPDLKQTPSGTLYVRFTIAINRNYKNQQGQYDTDFIPCTAWRQTAEFISKHFEKGKMIYIVGRLQSRAVGEGEDRRTYYEVNVNDAGFTGDRGQSGRPAYEMGDAYEPPETGGGSGFFDGSDDTGLPFDL